MTHSRAPADPYVTTFESTVAAVDGRDVALTETYFYPRGGGQPADRGTLEGAPVTDVVARDGRVVHELAAAPECERGDAVVGQIDEAFRTYCARAHTASHVLYGAGRRLLEGLGYGGFDISPERVRIDFRTDTEIDDGVATDLERLANRAVWDAHPVAWETLPRAEALDRSDVAFNAATEEGVTGETVRIVEIGPDGEWDAAACGGTHVENTGEIGPITLLDRSNPGEGLTRVEFAVGPTGIERRAAERAALSRAARALDAPSTDVGSAAEALVARREELEAERDALRDAAIEARIADLPVEEVDGVHWRIGTLEGFGPNEVGDAVRDLARERGGVVAVAGEEGTTFLAVAADAPDVDAAAVVERVTDDLGGGGGGSPEFAQGGGVGADPERVAAALRPG
jgi:alanyl-tRNA synthetase